MNDKLQAYAGLVLRGHAPEHELDGPMKALTLSSFAALVVLATATQASATIISETYTGVVAGNSFDFAGLFGPASPNTGALDGDAFTLAFTIDSTKGSGSFSSAGGSLRGGVYENAPSPVIDAVITINGKSQTIDGAGYGDIERTNSPSSDFSRLSTTVQDTGYGSASTNLTVYDLSIPGDLTTPFTLEIKNSPIYNYGGGSFVVGVASGSGSAAGGALDLYTLTVAAVPLPASLPMFGTALVGLSIVGFGLRKKNVATVA